MELISADYVGSDVSDEHIESGESMTLEATVRNTSSDDHKAIVDWYIGNNYVGSWDQIIEARQKEILGQLVWRHDERLEITRSYSDLKDAGVQDGVYDKVAAVLREGPTWDAQTINIGMLAVGKIAVEEQVSVTSISGSGGTNQATITFTIANPTSVPVDATVAYNVEGVTRTPFAKETFEGIQADSKLKGISRKFRPFDVPVGEQTKREICVKVIGTSPVG